MDLRIKNNTDEKQYEVNVEGHTARIEYIVAQNKVYLTHTEVPTELGGRGVGSALVKGVLADIEKQGQILVPLCPFVASYIKRHPEWRRIVGNNIRIA